MKFRRMRSEIVFDGCRQFRLRQSQCFIQDDEDFVSLAAFAILENRLQKQIVGREHAPGEMHLMTKTHLNRSLNEHGHETNLRAWQILFETYLIPDFCSWHCPHGTKIA